MTGPPPPPPTSGPEEERAFREAVEARRRRRLRARAEGDRSVWKGLGVFGMVGWAVSLPTLLGIAVGLWIDRRFPGSYSWTLTLLCLGVALGCWNAWTWIQREQRED
jgi:ATP synthase protein I